MEQTVFMVMPFGDDVANLVYVHSTIPVVESSGLRIVRADEIFSASPVFDDIVAAIEQAVVIIVDISGQNPNCLYELGMAHTLKRSRTIMITHDTYEEAPFDIAHFRIIQYENSIPGKAKYEEQLEKTLHSIMTGLPEIYADEFTFLHKVIRGADKGHAILVLQALSKAERPISPTENVEVEGRLPDYPNDFTGMAKGGPTSDYLKPFLDVGYVTVVGGALSLADKGRAFVEFAVSEGYVVHRLNDQVFVEGYVPFADRMRDKGFEMEES